MNYAGQYDFQPEDLVEIVNTIFLNDDDFNQAKQITGDNGGSSLNRK